ERARVAGQRGREVVDAMPADDSDLPMWAEGLAAVTACLPAEVAASICDPAARRLLGPPGRPNGLRAIGRLAPRLSPELRDAAAIAVVSGYRYSRSGSDIGVLIELTAAGPLPPQILVEVLKKPWCVGPDRRSVLDAL